MDKDVKCPYCGHDQDINHDDGYGYAEDEKHNQECGRCGKTFGYITTIVFYYDSFKTDCLNDAEHEYEVTNTYPEFAKKMLCKCCGYERDLTNEERKKHNVPTYEEWCKQNNYK